MAYLAPPRSTRVSARNTASSRVHTNARITMKRSHGYYKPYTFLFGHPGTVIIHRRVNLPYTPQTEFGKSSDVVLRTCFWEHDVVDVQASGLRMEECGGIRGRNNARLLEARASSP